MATAREKNGRWYFRITLSTNGRNKYLEECLAAENTSINDTAFSFRD